jgi:RNA polymerase sigma-70 factor, ECF subfamily
LDDLDQLAHAARAGDEAALDRLVTAMYPAVRLLAVATVGLDAADRVAQETFLRAVDRLPKFWGKAQARTWILQIARRVCLDEIRAQPGRSVDPGGAAESDPGLDHDRQLLSGLAARLSALDTDLAMAFTLTQLLGLTYQESGTVTGLPAQMIRLEVMEAREALIADPSS